MKTIKFKDVSYEVPDWVNYVAQNCDTKILFYEYKPRECYTKGYWISDCGRYLVYEPKIVMVEPTCVKV